MKRKIKKIINQTAGVLLFCMSAWAGWAQPGTGFPRWQEGELEIHHINTGKGEAVFCILPDGTTLLIDAGDLGEKNDPRRTPAIPANSRAPGEWIARYIEGLLPFQQDKGIDYMMVTHFDKDHIGAYTKENRKIHPQGRYVLSGISEVANFVPIRKLIDRAYPDYRYPAPLTQSHIQEYRKFVEWNIAHQGMKAERFHPGKNDQFTLVHHPERYRHSFEIRNIMANGEVWTGVGTETRHHFPEPQTLKNGKKISENHCSAGIRISYGAFDYYNGGDIEGYRGYNSEEWEDIETPVGKAVGPVEVCEANHHGWWNAMNANFIAALRPQVYIMQVWNVSHFAIETLMRMQSRDIYPGDRDIYATNIPEISKTYVGFYLKDLKGEGGHIVVKVQPGGDSYTLYVLDDGTENYTVKYVSKTYTSR